MFNKSYEEIVRKIKEETKISEEEIEKKVQEKIKQLSDLVSKEGAAHIVANQLGIKLFEDLPKRELKVKDLFAGMGAVSLLARVINIFNIIEFNKENRQGRVVSLVVGDETGVTRLAIWDERYIKQVEENKIKINDIIRIRNAYSRENNGNVELHLGSKGQIVVNPEGEKVETVKFNSSKKKINELKEGDTAEVFGTIVQLFEPKYYFACPECNKKVDVNGEKHECKEHGVVVGKKMPVVNLFFDDGTDNLRVVAFREQAENLFDDRMLEDFELAKKELLGKQLCISGRVVRNDMFDRLEFIAREFNDIDPLDIVEEVK